MQLNEQQILPVEHTEGPVLVLAGAGSGKTRVLTARVSHLIKDLGVLPYQILAITFTNKAAMEMKERIAKECDGEGVWISTFHSFCAKVLRVDGSGIGLGDNFSILDADDTKKILKRICKEKAFDKSLVKAVIDVIYYAKNFGIGPHNIEEKLKFDFDAEVLFQAKLVYDEYEEYKKVSNAVDFDDLIVDTIKLFTICPNVLEKYQKRFRYIHIDEFQDTNGMQYLLVKMLSSYHNNIFVVGDEDQGIYSWRGADIRNIISFKKDYKNVAVYKLEQNYRSTANILRVANAVIKNNTERIDKTLWTNAPNGPNVEIVPCRSDKSEAEYVINNVYKLVQNGYKYSDIAVLYRTSAISRLFEEKLNLYNMPYKIYGGYKFFEREEIKTINAYFRASCNPKDQDAIVRIINFPARQIGDTTIQKLVDYAKNNNIDLIDVILNIDNNDSFTSSVKMKVGAFRDVLIKLIDKSLTATPIEFAEYLLQVVPIEDAYKQLQEKQESNDKLENIATYIASISDFTKDNKDTTIINYLQSVALLTDTDNVEDDNYIRLATIHAVKGLEFKVVFVVGLEEGTFPSSLSVEEGRLEEERRLMYVAVTRAMQKLVLTYCATRFRFNSIKYYQKSCFIEEILEGLNVKQPPKKQVVQAKKVDTNKYSINNVSSASSVEGVVQAPKKEKDLSVFKAGTKVKHKAFGIGTIISVTSSGVASIAFDGLGIKKFSLEIAPVEVYNG